MPLRSIRAPAVLVLSILLGPVAPPCMAADEAFSIGIRTEGQKLLVVGNNTLSHDLICEYTIGLLIGELGPRDQPPPDVQQPKPPQSSIPEALGANTTGIGGQGALLPKGSVDHVLDNKEFRGEIVSAVLTKYGCRPRATMLLIEKDQSRILPNR